MRVNVVTATVVAKFKGQATIGNLRKQTIQTIILFGSKKLPGIFKRLSETVQAQLFQE